MHPPGAPPATHARVDGQTDRHDTYAMAETGPGLGLVCRDSHIPQGPSPAPIIIEIIGQST